MNTLKCGTTIFEVQEAQSRLGIPHRQLRDFDDYKLGYWAFEALLEQKQFTLCH